MREHVKKMRALIEQADPNGNYSQKDWLDVMMNAYKDVEDSHLAAEEFRAWTDDANDYSAEGTSHVKVSITSYSSIHESDRDVIHMTDFQLTPEQAKSMFLGIRDKYRVEED